MKPPTPAPAIPAAKALSQDDLERLVFAREELERLIRRHAAIRKTLTKEEGIKEKVTRILATIEACLAAGTAVPKRAGDLHGRKLQMVLLCNSMKNHREDLAALGDKANRELARLAAELQEVSRRLQLVPAAESEAAGGDGLDALRAAAAIMTELLGDGAFRDELAAQLTAKSQKAREGTKAAPGAHGPAPAGATVLQGGSGVLQTTSSGGQEA